MLTAAREAALEGHSLGHGVLTYAVLGALGQSRPENEMIDVKAVDIYVVKEVERLSRLLNKEQQTSNKIGANFPIGLPQSQIGPPPWKPIAGQSRQTCHLPPSDSSVQAFGRRRQHH